MLQKGVWGSKAILRCFCSGAQASSIRVRSLERATAKQGKAELRSHSFFNTEIVPDLPSLSRSQALFSLLPR